MKPLTFTGKIVKIGVLRSVIVPADIADALGGGARIPVIARYAGENTKSTLVPAGGGKRRLVLQMDVVRPTQLDAGDCIEVSLTPDTGPQRPPLPADLQRALQFRPTAAAQWEHESPSSWRMIIASLESARTPETRQRRLERLVEHLVENAARRAPKAKA